MKMKALASIAFLFSLRATLLAINCPDPVGNCAEMLLPFLLEFLDLQVAYFSMP